MSELHWVYAIIGFVIVAMASNRVRYDFVALVVVLSLVLSGVLTTDQALAGFGHPVVIMVAALLIVGDMLDKTGVAARVGEFIMQRGAGRPTRLLIMLMLASAGLSSVMSSTAVVAIFIPIVFRICAHLQLSARLFLLPIAYAALVSGMMTLIATPPNLVVSEQLVSSGYAGLGFFSFAPIGVVVLLGVIALTVMFGRRVWHIRREEKASTAPPLRSFTQLWQAFSDKRQIYAVKIPPLSRLAGRSLAESGLEQYQVRVLARIRHRALQENVSSVTPDMLIHQQDQLLISACEQDFKRWCESGEVIPVDDMDSQLPRWLWQFGASVLLLHPDSPWLGQTAKGAALRSRYGFQVMSIKRHGELLEHAADEPLQAGDMLFVVGAWKKLFALASHKRHLTLLETPAEQANYVPAATKAPIAIAILSAMVLASIFQWVPLVVAALLAAIAAVLTGCLNVKQAYGAMSWSSIVLVAGMLPLATALEMTGGSEQLVGWLLDAVGEQGPRVMLLALFVLTALLTMVLSNTASALLLAPIAIGAATALGVSPYPFALAVLMGASAAFASPIATPVVTLVVEPGEYSLRDFLVLGLPALVWTAAVTLWLVPVFFPF